VNKDPFDIVDREIVKDVKFFFNQVNDKALYFMGIKDSYNDYGVPALHESVEYFHPQITLDDRMRYIAENIVLADISQNNVICNTIISHFYGGRGIHQVATKELDPKKAHVDFDRLLIDEEYKNKIIGNLEDGRNYGIPIYGTTELRTSLFGAANAYVAKKDNKERDAHSGNILQWVAGFIERGITEKMINANSLKEMFDVLTKLEGVGSYYGYHCSTSNSVNPNINVNHDESFCVPGPGARKTLDLLFPGVSAKEFDYGDRVIWFRENQVELLGEFPLHESTHNIIVNGQKIFKDEQSDLKTYGCEVGLCQYGVYHRLKNEPKLAGRRKVARIDNTILENFINNVPLPEVPIKVKKIKKPKKMEVKEEPQLISVINENFSKLPDGYNDPFPGVHLKDPSSFKRKNIIAIEVPSKETLKKEISKVEENIETLETLDVVEVLENTLMDELKKVDAVIPNPNVTLVKKPKTKSVPASSKEKIDLIMGIIDETGLDDFTHSDVLSVVQAKGGLGLKLDSNWKESWAIMQSMVNNGTLEKIGRKYRKMIIKNI